MPKRVIPPYRLQPDTRWPDAMAFIDLNFNNMVTSFSGFSTEVSSLSVGGGGTINSGLMDINTAYVYMREEVEDLVFIHPIASLYVDIPDPATFDVFNPPDDYLWPTGSGITADGLAMLSSVTIGIKTGAELFPDAAPPTYDGVGYTLGAPISHILRNGGSDPHTYFVLLSYFAYSKSESFYR